jgi:Peroxidase
LILAKKGVSRRKISFCDRNKYFLRLAQCLAQNYISAMMIRSIATVSFLSLWVTCSDAFQVAPPLGVTTTRASSVLHASNTAEEASYDDSRRTFMASGVMAGISSLFVLQPTMPARAADAAGVDYKAVANDIMNLVKANPDKGPTLVRLAWHSSGTYDKVSKTGGSGGGTIRFKSELAHGGNAGLASTAVKWLEPIHAKYAKAGLSYADLYTLAGGRL